MFQKRLIIFLFSFLFLQNQLFSSAVANVCENFAKSVVEEYEPIPPFEEKNDIGILFDYEWDEKNQKTIIKRNKDDFPIIRFSLFEEKLYPGVAVKTFNGEDLSKIDDDNINNMIENYETVEIQFFDESEIDTIEVSSQKYDSLIFILDNFILNSINEIEAKEGFFSIDHYTSFFYKRPDLKKEGKQYLPN